MTQYSVINGDDKPVKSNITDNEPAKMKTSKGMPGTFHIIDQPQWNTERTNRIKRLVNGKYKPKGLMDQFYGELPQEIINAGLPAFTGDVQSFERTSAVVDRVEYRKATEKQIRCKVATENG